jgi:hypothetical protein
LFHHISFLNHHRWKWQLEIHEKCTMRDDLHSGVNQRARVNIAHWTTRHRMQPHIKYPNYLPCWCWSNHRFSYSLANQVHRSSLAYSKKLMKTRLYGTVGSDATTLEAREGGERCSLIDVKNSRLVPEARRSFPQGSSSQFDLQLTPQQRNRTTKFFNFNTTLLKSFPPH